MKKVAQYLRTHLQGEVYTDKSTLDYFNTDGSVLTVQPKIVVYPRKVSDVRKVARFAWQLAEKGTPVPITARGLGTDQAGAALGKGIIMVLPAHVNKLIELGKDYVVVQPGLRYQTLQQVLHTHGRFLPPYPSSIEFSSIGGAVANNAGGENTLKYGKTINYVQELEVVLANGEIITTKRLSKRELNKKMGQTTFEAEIYRQVDTIISDNQQAIDSTYRNISKNSAGYNLADVKRKDGSFDLTPLFVGSQGTLGIITQIKLKTEEYTPDTSLVLAYFDDPSKLGEAVDKLRPLGASALEVVDEHLLNFVHKTNPSQLDDIIEPPYPKVVLIVEFDENNAATRKRKVKKAKKIIEKLAYEYSTTTDPHEQDMIWRIRHSAAAVASHDAEDGAKALPIIEDGVVPHDKLVEFLNKIYSLFAKYGLETAVWGHAGNANLHTQPFLNLSKIGDRQKVFKLMDEYYKAVIDMGGSTNGEHNDGRLRAPYLKAMYGSEVYSLYEGIKVAFDPHNILNPGVKLGVTQKDLISLLRKEFSLAHLGDHLPRT